MYITRFVRRTNGRNMSAVRRPGRTTKGAVLVEDAQASDQPAKTKTKAKAKSGTTERLGSVQ